MDIELYSHLEEEIGIPNIALSLSKDDGKIEKIHRSIHEFVCLPAQLIDSEELFQAHSAFFVVYHGEIFDVAHRSLLETLSGHYNEGYILLRTVLELLVKGTFLNCIAHEDYRNDCDIDDKTVKKLIKEIKSQIRNKSSLNELEEKSSLILANKSVIDKNRFRFDKLIHQLGKWGILDPIDDSKDVYKIYGSLSGNVHINIYNLDISRRLVNNKPLFETKVIFEELDTYLDVLKDLMDLAIIMELNLIENEIIASKSVKDMLEKRILEISELDLHYTNEKIKKILSSHKI